MSSGLHRRWLPELTSKLRIRYGMLDEGAVLCECHEQLVVLQAGDRPLHHSVAAGNHTLVMWLVDKAGARTDVANNVRSSPCHC